MRKKSEVGKGYILFTGREYYYVLGGSSLVEVLKIRLGTCPP